MWDASRGCDEDIRATWSPGGLVLVLVLVLLTAAPARGADPGFERPRVGSCHGLGFRDVLRASDPSQPVSCAGFHTTRTIAVMRLPDGLGWPRLGRVDAGSVLAVGRCHAAWRGVLGSTAKVRIMSAYRFAVFIPTTAQRRRGARWVRCDLMRLGGGRLLALNAQVRLSGPPLADAVAACIGPRLILTACSEPHVLRAVTAYTLRMVSYPGREVMQAEANRRCPELAGSPWLGVFPLEWQWRYGDRQSVCYGFDPTD